MLFFFVYYYIIIICGDYMNLLLLKKVYNAAINNEVLINKDFISGTINLFAKEMKLGEYFMGDEYKEKAEFGRSSAAEYDGDTNKITFYFDALKGVIDIYANNCNLPEFDTILLKNLLIVRSILHELGHAAEGKTIDENCSLEAEVLCLFCIAMDNLRTKICPHDGDLDDEVVKFYKIVDGNYYSNPAERITIIRSTVGILDIISPIKDEVPLLYRYIVNMLFDDLSYGYFYEMRNCTCPTETFFTNIGQRDVWTQFDFYRDSPLELINYVSKEYSLSERLLLGLPVSPRIWHSKKFIMKLRTRDGLRK